MSKAHDLANQSDSEDDEDYVPPDKPDSASEESDEDERTVAQVVSEATEDEETKKTKREALWSSFQASVAGPSKPQVSEAEPPRLVKIERRFKFAGKDIVEVVEVPEDSSEARKWPRWKDPNEEEISTAPTPSRSQTPALSESTSQDVKPTDPLNIPSIPETAKVNSPPSSSIQAPPPTIDKPPPKRPGPRKSKTTLAPLPGQAKPKKLTTLDKSAMDWKSHIQLEQEAGSSIKDDLEANRRAGGYLEKVEFLKRVDERKEHQLDSMKGSKRRKL